MKYKKIKNNYNKLKKLEKKYIYYKYLLENEKIDITLKIKVKYLLNIINKNKFRTFCFLTKNFKSNKKNYNLSRHILKQKYSSGYINSIRKGIW